MCLPRRASSLTRCPRPSHGSQRSASPQRGYGYAVLSPAPAPVPLYGAPSYDTPSYGQAPYGGPSERVIALVEQVGAGGPAGRPHGTRSSRRCEECGRET